MGLLGKTLKGRTTQQEELGPARNIRVREIIISAPQHEADKKNKETKEEYFRKQIQSEEQIYNINKKKLLANWRKILRIAKTEELKKELEKLKMSTEARFDLFGLNKLHAMTQLYDNLRCIRFEFGSLPLGFSEDIYKKLELIATGYFMAKYEFDNIVKIYTTKMSEKISEAFLRKVSDTWEQLAEVKPESKLGRLKGM
mgnify:CR=1 FL=1